MHELTISIDYSIFKIWQKDLWVGRPIVSCPRVWRILAATRWCWSLRKRVWSPSHSLRCQWFCQTPLPERIFEVSWRSRVGPLSPCTAFCRGIVIPEVRVSLYRVSHINLVRVFSPTLFLSCCFRIAPSWAPFVSSTSKILQIDQCVRAGIYPNLDQFSFLLIEEMVHRMTKRTTSAVG